MQPGYHAKIKNLIKISSVLAEAERADWLSMVDLMNDKQLVELEKILSSGLAHAAPVAGSSSAPRPPVQPLQAAAASPSPPQRPSAAVQRFSDRVERMVQTAELREGYPKDEPELPPPPPAPRQIPVPQPVDVASLLRRRAEAAVSLPSRPASVVAARPPAPPPPVSPPKKPLPPAPPPPPPETPSPAALKDRPTRAFPPSPRPSVELRTLEELSAFGVTNWLGYPSGEFAAKLQQLMVRFGYHSVVFSLEKSPLFKSYVDTGVEILNQRANFGTSEDGALSMQHLSRREFERLSDVFRQLHIG